MVLDIVNLEILREPLEKLRRKTKFGFRILNNHVSDNRLQHIHSLMVFEPLFNQFLNLLFEVLAFFPLDLLPSYQIYISDEVDQSSYFVVMLTVILVIVSVSWRRF